MRGFSPVASTISFAVSFGVCDEIVSVNTHGLSPMETAKEIVGGGGCSAICVLALLMQRGVYMSCKSQ